ncbi:MAG: hypothetical protein IKP10_01895 [Clostridia bacterium]|nr:hypothetical protein [Clostridia bacterium]
MDLYSRNLRRIGIVMILVSVFNLAYEFLARAVLEDMGSAYVRHIPLPWGICAKNLIGAAAGVFALSLFYEKKRRRGGTLILILLCAAEAAVIILSTAGRVGARTNGLIDMTMLMMIVLTYTFSQRDRALHKWERTSARPAAVLDLRLPEPGAFFNTVQAGPQMLMSDDYAAVVTRYLRSVGPAPLRINLLCAQPVSDSMRGVMRDVLAMYYGLEEKRVAKALERKYYRIVLLLLISLLSIGLMRQFSIFGEEAIAWDIIGNFAAFGLWQIGYLHFERSEGYEELLLIHCAKYAQLEFLERQGQSILCPQ